MNNLNDKKKSFFEDIKIFNENYKNNLIKSSLYSKLNIYSQKIKEEIFDFSRIVDFKRIEKEYNIINEIPEIVDCNYSNFLSKFYEKKKLNFKSENLILFNSQITSFSLSWLQNKIFFSEFSRAYYTDINFINNKPEVDRFTHKDSLSFIHKSCFHPSDTLVAYSGESGLLFLTDVEKKKNLSTFNFHYNDNIIGIQFTSDGTRMITASRNGKVLIYDLIQSEVIRELKFENFISSIILSKNDSILIISFENGKIIYFNNNSEDINIINAHYGPIYSISLNNNNILCSGGFDKSLRIWDINQQLKPLKSFHLYSSPIIGTSFDQDDTFSSINNNGVIQIYSLKDFIEIKKIDTNCNPIIFNYSEILKGYFISNTSKELLFIKK